MLTLPAPAKINLFLHVVGQRAGGFHDIETLFQFLEFADSLDFEALEQPRIHRIDQHEFALPEEDLIVRAGKLLQATYPQAAGRGAAITLRKRIPPGSGLGGGSSNAATTLLALNHLWRLGASRRRLADLGRRLGADVPVFVRGRAALASGIGATLQPFAPPERWLCVCLPPVNASTAAVFSHPQLMANHPENRPGRRRATTPSKDIESTTGNDLEPVAALLYPEVAAALTQLRRFGEARMSGSGAAVYACFDSRQQAARAAAQLPSDLNPVITRSRNRHPLLTRIAASQP